MFIKTCGRYKKEDSSHIKFLFFFSQVALAGPMESPADVSATGFTTSAETSPDLAAVRPHAELEGSEEGAVKATGGDKGASGALVVTSTSREEGSSSAVTGTSVPLLSQPFPSLSSPSLARMFADFNNEACFGISLDDLGLGADDDDVSSVSVCYFTC
jgi:hypothetical protein